MADALLVLGCAHLFLDASAGIYRWSKPKSGWRDGVQPDRGTNAGNLMAFLRGARATVWSKIAAWRPV